MTDRSRVIRRGPALTALLAMLSLSYLRTGMVLSAQTTSGFNASEGSHISGTANFDTLWADSTRHRWMMNNNAASSDIPVSSWVCQLSPGCIPFSASSATYTIYPETQLTFPTGGPGLPLLSGNGGTNPGVPQWGGGTGLNANQTFALDLQTLVTGSCCALALATEVANDTSVGTYVNQLAAIASTGAQGVGTSGFSFSSFVPYYIVVYEPSSGLNKSGNAQLALDGQALCTMDSTLSSTQGLYVVASSTTKGDCAVSTSAPSFGTWIIGTMISSSTSVGNTSWVLVHPSYRAFGGITGLSNANGTSLATTTAPSGLTSGDLASWDSNKNATDSNIAAANVLTLNAPATGTILSGNGTQTPNAIATGTYGFPLASAGSSAQPSYQRQLITSIPSSDTLTAAGTFATTLSIPGGLLAAGSVIEIRAHGVYSTPSSGTAVFALQINAGGTSGICPASSNITLSTSSSISNGYWDTACTIQITNAANSAIAWGQYDVALAGGSSAQFRMFNNATSTGVVTYTTGSAQTVSLQETATLISGQSVTLQALYAKVIY